MKSGLVAACLAAVPLALSAQGPGPIPPPRLAPPARQAAPTPREMPVIVAGCLSGRTLRPAAAGKAELPTLLLNASEFLLEGSRELLQQISREHAGHFDEIDGIAIVPSPARSDIETKQLGKRARVVVGRRLSTASIDPPRPVRLKVGSLRHLSNTCAAD